jgi:mono/diheme cytochrome c family protein
MLGAVFAIIAVKPAQVLAIFGIGEEPELAPLEPVPEGYRGKKMPEGWWTDPKVIAAGREIYEGKTNPEVKCFECHGSDGVPTRKGRGARDFRNEKNMNRFTDDYWFWRVSEGIPKTKMQSWKEHLSEDQRWQVMAYEHTFSHGGKAEPHEHAEQKRAAP